MPNPWEIGAVNLQERDHGSGDPYRATPFSVGIDIGGRIQMRMNFYVVNGTGPIATGEIQLERNVNGAGWLEDVIGNLKNYEPGWTEGSDPVVDHPPVWVEFDAAYGELFAGDSIAFRARADWEVVGAAYSPTLTVLVAEDLRDAGELLEFFRDEDHGATANVRGLTPRRIRGQFDDPGAHALRIQGRRPSLLCEHAQADPLLAGDTLTIDGRDFVLRGKRRATDTTRLVLEEVG